MTDLLTGIAQGTPARTPEHAVQAALNGILVEPVTERSAGGWRSDAVCHWTTTGADGWYVISHNHEAGITVCPPDCEDVHCPGRIRVIVEPDGSGVTVTAGPTADPAVVARVAATARNALAANASRARYRVWLGEPRRTVYVPDLPAVRVLAARAKASGAPINAHDLYTIEQVACWYPA